MTDPTDATVLVPLDCLGEAVLLTDGAGIVVDANRAALALLARARATVLGHPLQALLAPPQSASRPFPWPTHAGEIQEALARPADAPDSLAPLLRLRLSRLSASPDAGYAITLIEAPSATDTRVLDVAADGILVIDSTQRIVRFNQGAEQIFGWTADEMLGQSITALLPSEHRGRHGAFMESFDRGEVDSRVMGNWLPVTAQRRDGTVFPLEVTISRSGDGDQRVFVAVMRDVTRRIQSEKAVRESERLFRAVFEQTSRLIWLLRPDGTILRANPRALELCATPPAGMAGHPFADLDWSRFGEDGPARPSPEMRAEAQSAMARAASGEVARAEIGLLSTEGPRSLDLTVKPVSGEGDGVIAVLAEAIDLTRRVRAEQAVTAREAELANAQRIARMGSWTSNLLTGELIWSDETYRLFGLPRLPEGQRPPFWEHLHPDDQLLVRKALDGMLEKGGTTQFEHRVVRPDGTVRWMLEHAELIRDDAGRSLRIAGTTQDITERKAMEDSLRLAKLAAEQANEAKSEFLANMSHELRTPLNAVVGFATVLESQMFGPLGHPRYADYAGDIRQSGEHLLRIFSDILEMAQLEANAVTLDISLAEVGKLIQAAVDSMAAQTVSAQLDIIVNVPPGLPPIRVDRCRLELVLINLLSNAVKFTAAGGIVVIAASEGPDGGVQIQVTDNGIGMTQGEIARVMEPFGQLQSAFSRNRGGIGLGLPLVRSLVALHDGEFVLESVPGEGTVASIRLPPARSVRTRAVEIASA